MYPLLRNVGEGLALGAVAFRIVESVFYLVAALGLLALLWLGQGFARSGPEASSTYQILGSWTLSVRDSANFVLGVLAFCLGAAIYYYLMHQARLVPRWLSLWGLAGVAVLCSMAVLVAFGEKPSGRTLLLAIPIAVQELVLAGWLIVKGFDSAQHGQRAGVTTPQT